MQGHLPIHKRRCFIVPCARDLPDNAHPGYSQKTAFLTPHSEKRESDGASSWTDYIGVVSNQNPNMIKGLTPYQILGQLTSQTEKCMKFAGRKDQRWMVGSYIERFITVFAQRNEGSSEPDKVAQARIWVYRFFFKKKKRLRKATHHLDRFNRIRRTCARRFWNEQRQERCVLLICVVTGF